MGTTLSEPMPTRQMTAEQSPTKQMSTSITTPASSPTSPRPTNKNLHTHHRSASGTFSAQGELARLPIPTLEETLEKFPKILWALQDQGQREETHRIVEEFRLGDGPRLQALLEAYEEQGRDDGTLGSYVEEFWNDSYLAPDQSVVLNLNPFFVLEEGPDAKTAKDPILRAAALTFASVKLASLLKHETLDPDVFRGKALCMDQFKALFGSCRIPEKGEKDAVAVYPDSSHVAVMSRDQLYYFQALWPDGTVAVDEDDIVDILKAIQRDSAKMGRKDAGRNALGVLTSLPRQEWAMARRSMVESSPDNGDSLQIVDSALFVLILDDFTPRSVHETAANMLHGTYQLEHDTRDGMDSQVGTCCNRWYDKLQIIVCADGTSGINFEHSAIDGHTALRFVSDIFAETVVNFAQSITKLIHGHGRIPHVVNAVVKRAALVLDNTGRPVLDVFPKKLVFDLPASVKERIYFAETALGDQIVASDTVVLEFKEYGKSLIVANQMSPDSFVQMSMLLAYYQLYGKIVCMYEPVLTKHFYHGRTEAMRPATPAAADFCRMWSSHTATGEEKLQSLKKATVEHSRLVRESSGGKGVDRHLFALRCIAERHDIPIPAFFQSTPWTTLNHTILSTSNCGNPSLRLFGFGPVVQDGFGIGYIIKDNGLQYSVSSKHRQTRRYVHTLKTTLLEMEELMKPISSMEVVGSHRHSLKDESKVYNNYGGIWGETDGDLGVMPKELQDEPESNEYTKYFAKVERRNSSIRHGDLAKIGIRVDLGSTKEEE